jgi:hypothetical protein
MASGWLTEDDISKIDPYKDGGGNLVLGRSSTNINFENEKAARWQPTFTEVRDADYRLNTVSGALASRNKTKEQKELEENDAREVLEYGSFGQNVAASLTQYENIGVTLASIALPPLGVARTAGVAARIGLAAGANMATTAAQEAALHTLEETRTLQESAYYVIGAGVIGGGLSGVGEGVARLFGRSMGPAEKAMRDAKALQGYDFEHGIGNDIAQLGHAQLQMKDNVPLTMRLNDELLGSGALGKDDSIGAMRVNPNEHIMGGPETPDALPMDGVWLHDSEGLPLGPGPRAQDSVNPTMNKLITGTDRVASKFFGDTFMTWGGRINQSEFMQVKALAADLLPNSTRTQLAASGRGQRMDLYSAMGAFSNRVRTTVDEIRNKGLADYQVQMKNLSAEEHDSLITELAERSHVSRRDAYEQVAQMINNASKGKLFKNTKDRHNKALADFNRLTTYSMRNSDDSVLGAVSRRAKRLRQEFINPTVERGNTAGVWSIDLEAPRATADTHVTRVWDKQALLARTDGNAYDFIRDAAPFMDASNPNGRTPFQQAEELHRHLITTTDDLDLVDIKGTGVNFSKGLVFDNFPDNVFSRYLENDIDVITSQTARRAQREIVPAEHFGSPEWQQVYNDRKNLIHQEFTDKVGVLTDKITDPAKRDAEVARLKLSLDKDISELEYGLKEALGMGDKLSEGVQAIKAGTAGMFLGRAMFANIADLHSAKLVDVITKYIPGYFTEAGEAARRMFRDPSMPESVQREQAKRFGVIVDQAQSELLYHSMHDVVNEMEKQNVKSWKHAAEWFGTATHIASGMKLFNDVGKKVHTTDVVDRSIKAVLGKRELAHDEIAEFGRFSFGVREDAPMFDRIRQQALAHSDELDGIHYANVSKWTDPQAAEFYTAFVKKYVDTRVLAPDPTTKMLAERNAFGNVFFQFTSFIRAFIDKQLVPTAEAGVPALTSMYLKLAALNYMGAYAREVVYGTPTTEGELNTDKVAIRALNNTLLLPSSIMMAGLKVLEGTVISPMELFGLEPVRPMREAIPAIGAAKRLGGLAKQGTEMALSDEDTPEEKQKKFWLNAQAIAPILNTPIMELPAQLIIKQFYRNE